MLEKIKEAKSISFFELSRRNSRYKTKHLFLAVQADALGSVLCSLQPWYLAIMVAHDSQTVAPFPGPAATGNCPSDLGSPLFETFLGLHIAWKIKFNSVLKSPCRLLTLCSEHQASASPLDLRALARPRPHVHKAFSFLVHLESSYAVSETVIQKPPLRSLAGVLSPSLMRRTLQCRISNSPRLLLLCETQRLHVLAHLSLLLWAVNPLRKGVASHS